MRGNERAFLTQKIRLIAFTIPMRGNECMKALDLCGGAARFTIPMRGNECLKKGRGTAGKVGFTIPMRGNELEVRSAAIGTTLAGVYDPHEG